MGVMPVNRLLLSMAIPIMLSMLVQALYNVVDSIFVAKISEDALTAVSLAFPIQNLMIAVSSGIGVGMNALLSRSLGEKNQKQANEAAMQSVFLMFIGYLLFVLFAVFGAGLFMKSQTDQAEIFEPGVQYLQIVTGLSFGLMGQMLLERMLQATGKTIYTMITQGTGAIVNIILDPIFIFGLLGMPKLGVAGAALATVIGQCVAAVMALLFNLKVNREIQLQWKNIKPRVAIIGQVLSVGIPSMIMVSIGSIMTYGMNRILLSFTSTAAAVFGVYFKLQSFVFMPVFGLSNGMIPIVAYNYGARNKERLLRTVRLSMLYAISLMALGLLVFQLFPHQLLEMFDASEQMLTIGLAALRIISLSFLFAGFGIISSSVFQALGNGLYSMTISICRQLVVLLPAAFLLARLGDVSVVWWAFPISEIASVTLAALFLIRMYRTVIRPLGQKEQEVI